MSLLEIRQIHAEIFTTDNTDQTLGTFAWNLTIFQSSSAEARVPEVSSSVSYIVGVLMIIIVVLGLIENGTVLFVFSRTRKLRQADMSFVIGLSLSDMGQTALNLPFVAVACFYKRWVFGTYGCMYIGFVTTWFGLSQISLLCVIALERYFIIVQQCRRLSASTARTVGTIAGCFMYGGCWAVGPLVGWSEYNLVAGEISCSLSWTLKNDLYLSYVLALFSLVWFLPLGIITFSYSRIAQMVYIEKRKRQSMRVTRKVSKERKVAVTVLLMIVVNLSHCNTYLMLLCFLTLCAFVISWTPYSVVALMTAFGDMSKASSAVYLIPAVFAKASIIWNPIIYIARHKEFRRACDRTRRHMLSWLSQYTTLRVFFREPTDSSTFSKSMFSERSDKSVNSSTTNQRSGDNKILYQNKVHVDLVPKVDITDGVLINQAADFRVTFPSSVCAEKRKPTRETEPSSASSSTDSGQTFYLCENVSESNMSQNNGYKMGRCSLPSNHVNTRRVNNADYKMVTS